METNKVTYSNKKIVNHYINYKLLQKPEETIFNLLNTELYRMKMLDLGVGAGRTSLRYADAVKEYVGLDYSEEMIAFCKEKFKIISPKANFIVRDVRDLSTFVNHQFDFILFSFNGLDYISHEERITVLKEIKRILHPEGYFCFSTHNIQTIDTFLKIKFRFNLIALIKSTFNIPKFIRLNKESLKVHKTADHVIINDGAHNFGLQTYYIRPKLQVELLKNIGYKTIKVYNLSDGNELKNEDELSNNTDNWLYYLCN